MEVLEAAGISFLVGGAYALRAYADVVRDTKDFDLMLRRSDVDRALAAFRAAGFRAEIVFPHWIAKVHYGECFLDIIYNSGNGLCPIDDEWFEHAHPNSVLGHDVLLCPAEEIIWQKAYIMERERFDGADVVHLLKSRRERLDWDRLVRRFGGDGQILLAHLLVAQFVYPNEPDLVPASVVERLLRLPRKRSEERLCNGTLLSRAQYLPDIERWNFVDARLHRGMVGEEDLRVWTAAIDPAADLRG